MIKKSTHPIDEVAEDVDASLRRGKKGRRIEGQTLREFVTQRPVFDKNSLNDLAKRIDIPDELPLLPNRIREFAFRYATEFRSYHQWAGIFHVSTTTILHWLHKPEVMQYIIKIRWERSALMAERLNNLEVSAYSKLQDILDTPITKDTISAIRETIKDVLGLRSRESLPKSTDESGINININQTNQSAAIVQTSEDLKRKIKRMEDLDSQLGDDSDSGDQQTR